MWGSSAAMNQGIICQHVPKESISTFAYVWTGGEYCDPFFDKPKFKRLVLYVGGLHGKIWP